MKERTCRILSVQELEKTYTSKGNRHPVLKKVGLTVAQGEFAAVIGPSGSGKNDAAEHITSGLLPADGGSVHIGETNI